MHTPIMRCTCWEGQSPLFQFLIYTTAKISVECQDNHSYGVKGCDDDARNQSKERHSANPGVYETCTFPRTQQYLVLTPKTGQRNDSHQAKSCNQH